MSFSDLLERSALTPLTSLERDGVSDKPAEKQELDTFDTTDTTNCTSAEPKRPCPTCDGNSFYRMERGGPWICWGCHPPQRGPVSFLSAPGGRVPEGEHPEAEGVSA